MSVRLSAVDWAIEMAKALRAAGADLIDVSSEPARLRFEKVASPGKAVA